MSKVDPCHTGALTRVDGFPKPYVGTDDRVESLTVDISRERPVRPVDEASVGRLDAPPFSEAQPFRPRDRPAVSVLVAMDNNQVSGQCVRIRHSPCRIGPHRFQFVVNNEDNSDPSKSPNGARLVSDNWELRGRGPAVVEFQPDGNGTLHELTAPTIWIARDPRQCEIVLDDPLVELVIRRSSIFDTKRIVLMQMEWNDRFPATAWSLIRNVRNQEGAAYPQAMNALIASYWRPVFYFVRSKGYPIQQAEDLTQEFFLKVCEKQSLTKADPKRGRFRTFLLTILVRFLSDQGPNRIPRQRGFENGLVSISTLVRDDERTFEPAAGDTPEDAFMKQWALATLNQAMENLRLTCEQRKYPAWYAMFLAYHFPDDDQHRPTKVSLATRFNLTEDQVKYGLEQANAMFSELLRAELKDQVLSVDDLDDELQELERWLTKASKEQKRGGRADGPTNTNIVK